MNVNPVFTGEHVSRIKRNIRRLKDGVREVYEVLLLYKMRALPAEMITELVHTKTFYKSAVLVLDGVSDTVSPCEMLAKQRPRCDRHCYLVFRQ